MVLDTEVTRRLLGAWKRRNKKLEELRASCFDKQLSFIDDPSHLKAAQCTRRSGKSYGGAGIYLCSESIKHPRSTCLYIATTREQARRIMLKDVLSAINREHSLGMKVNLTTLTVSFPNESLIYLMGLDSKPEEMEKALGQKYRLVIIDEGGSWRQDQKTMIHSVLQPACADYNGTIALLGSPVNNTKTYFYDITGRPQDDPGSPKGWSVHRWSWKDNPHVRKQMQRQIDEMLAANPLIVETPGFRQMYLNEWVTDPGFLCYRYDWQRNACPALPSENKYHYALGLDLGFNDDTAIAISAYSEYDPTMYFVEVFKQKKMDISAVAEVLERFRQKYNPFKWVVDGAAKQAVMELKNRFGFPLEPSDKAGKFEVIQIMNNDLIAGRIKLVMPHCESLESEWANLVWDEKSFRDPKARTVENSACANHLADAALYSWRMCYHFASRENVPKPKPGTDEAMEAWWDGEARKAQRTQKQDWLQQELGRDYGFH
jgi:hypothetical protein